MHAYVALDDRVLVVEPSSGSSASDHVATERLVGCEFECVTASSAVPDRVFAGTVESGLQRSTDGGDSWEAVGEFTDRVTAVTVSPHDPAVVWAGTEPSRIYRSTDCGDTWEHRDGLTELPSADRWSFPPRPNTHHVRWLAVDPLDPDHLYVAIEAGAFVRTTDAGRTWEPHPEGARRDNHTLGTHPDAPDRVYTAAGDGYAESHDGGDTWAYPQDGLDHRYVWGLAVDPADPDTVCLSAANGARSAHTPSTAKAYIYRRDGDSWKLDMDGLPDPDGMVRALLDSRFAGEFDSRSAEEFDTQPAGEVDTRSLGEFVAVTNRGLFRRGDKAWQRVDIDWPDAYETQVPRGLAVVE